MAAPSRTTLHLAAIKQLKGKEKGYFLMVEGGRIDHALHDTNAKRALQDTLAFDNAISEKAAKDKGIVSPVAGRAEVLVVPNLEAGNMLAKQLTFLGGADAAGVVLGARVPIILTSRADSLRTSVASCAIAVLLARATPKATPGPIAKRS